MEGHFNCKKALFDKLPGLRGICGLLISLLTVIFYGSCASLISAGKGLQSSPVYISGTGGYSHYRIPALLYADGILYAFSEARQKSVDDNGNISIVLKRSIDKGDTWGPLIKVIEIEGQSVQNPVPVYICEQKKLIVLFTKRTHGEDTEYQIRNGTSRGYMGVYMISSSDGGISWSAVIEITSMVKKENWRWYTVGPGGAIIMKNNRHYQGRIIVPANHSTHEGPGNEYLGAHVIFSDDNGLSWEIGATDSKGKERLNPNETAVIELKNGDLYFNTRNQSSNDTVSNRAYALSKDGGQTFEDSFSYETGLTVPVVHASLTRTKKEIFFFAPSDKKDRINLTVWSSRDEAKTWEVFEKVYTGSSAYSSACTLSEKELGVLFETDNYLKIIFKKLRLKNRQ